MSKPYLVDSHCHLNYRGLDEDMEGVIDRALGRNVQAFLAICTKISEFEQVLSIAETSDRLHCTVGIHPHEAEAEPDVELDALLSRTGNPKVVAIGETGLDYFHEFSPREAQKINFRTHIRAARESGLPLVVHSRDADDDMAAMLSQGIDVGEFTGVIHCFTASAAFARTALDLGFYISLSGIVTFSKSTELQEIVKWLPEDRILVETDAPFLAPTPNRGKRCEPSYVADTAAFVADLRGQTLEQLATITTENYFRLFSKAKPPGHLIEQAN